MPLFKSIRRLAGIASLLLIAGACQPQSPPSAGDGDGDGDSDDGSSIELKVVDRAGYDKVIAGHKGKVILVDYWATWCGPCKAQFPHTVELHKTHAAEGFAAVSLSFDDIEEQGKREEIEEFLTEQDARFDHLVSKFTANDEITETFDFDGTVPHYKLYDRTGKLRDSFAHDPDVSAEERLAEIDARVKELLAEK